MTQPLASARPRDFLRLLALLPFACLLWAFGSTLAETARAWSEAAEYSHGYLVPGFALVLLWLRRDRLDRAALRPSWWGLPVLIAGFALRFGGTYFYFVFLDQVALLPCLAGLCLGLGGRAAWRWAWPAILFLAFMIPLPFSVATALSGPLQRLATVVSTFLLQTLGLPALAEGNVILINDASIGIVEACSGLRMLMVFFALATGVALFIKRPMADKVFVLVSAVPIALISNIVRITVTGVLHETVGGERANAFFHDWAGYLMMPLGLGMLWAELAVLKRLFIDLPAKPERTPRPAPIAPRRAAARAARARQAAPPAREREPEQVAAKPVAETKPA
jgi:exosortase